MRALADPLDAVRQGVNALPTAPAAAIATALFPGTRGDADTLAPLALVLGTGTLTAGASAAVRSAFLACTVGRATTATGTDLAEVAADAVALLVRTDAFPVHAGGGDVALATCSPTAVIAAFHIDAVRDAGARTLNALPMKIL